MRILIDECVDPRIKRLFPDHYVRTVHEMGWDQLADGPLLVRAQEHFDVLISIDRGLEFQQNLSRLQLGVIIVVVPKNQLSYYEALTEQLLVNLDEVLPGRVLHVYFQMAKGI